MDRANTLLSAGFDPDEVGAWATQQRSTLGAAGFSEQEIDDHIGNRPKPVPPALLSRIEWGKALSQAVKPLDLMWPVPMARGLVKGALTNDEPGKIADILDFMTRVPEDMGVFVGRQVRHMFEGIPTPETAQRIGEGRGTQEEIINMAASALFTAGPVTRLPGGLAKVQRGPMGEVSTVPIGDLPKAEDFATARASVTEGLPAPQVHAKLERLYEEHGIHPAEVAHDAALDVTIKQDLLTSGDKLPEAYVKPTAPTPPPEPGMVSGLRSFAPGDLRVDAARFQFKEGADPLGVTERLQGVTQWDPIKSGLGIVYEGADGLYVVDGHQRYALAQKIARDDPTQQPRFNAIVLRAADGVSESDARIAAAGKNIAEGTGTAVDAAKVLRERPDLLDTLPPRSELVRQAQGLSNLSDEAFGAVINDVLPANYAAIVGRLAPDDPKMQGALINLLAKTEPTNIVQAESIVRQGMDAGLHVETQASLFGDQEIVSSLYAERARVLDRTLKILRRDQTVFQSIADNRAILEQVGNRLAQNENIARAAADAQAVHVLQTLANRRGLLGDALTAAARGIADGRLDIAAATRSFVAEIRQQAAGGTLFRDAVGGSRSPVADPSPHPAAPRGNAARAGERVAPPAEPTVAASIAQETAASERVQQIIRSEPTAQGDQLVMPGAERSAVQAAASREAEGHGRIASPTGQQDPGGLFAPEPSPQPSLFSREGIPISGERVPGELPIVRFRKDAAAIEAALPEPAAETTRLWRGNRPGEVGTGTAYTTDLAGIALPFREPYGGPISYIDVPTAELPKYVRRGSADPGGFGAEYTVSRELAGTAIEVPVRPVTEAGPFARLMRDESGSMQLGKSEPPRTDAERAILSRLSIGESDAGRPWSWSSFYTAVVDRLNPIRDAVREIAPGQKLATADDPYQLARLYAGVSGKADHFLTYGTFDFGKYQPTGKGLKDIIAPVLDDLDGFRAFATSLRALELDARGIKTGMDMDAARTVAAAGQAKYAPIMAELIQYQNKLAIYLRDAGVLSHEGYTAMRKENQLYLPFQRVFGEVAGDIIPDVIRGQGNSLQASNPIHAIKGSERTVVDPLESIVRNTYLSLAMAERNAAGTKLVDLIQRAGNLPVPRHADTISIYRNGVKEDHLVSADLAAAIKGLDEETANTLLRIMGAPARALRAGATLTPEFMLRNPIRDFFGAVVNTTKGVFSPIDTAKGLVSAIKKDADFQNWLKGGGANSALVSFDRRYLQQNIEQLTADTGLGTRAWNVVRHPIDTLRVLSEISEQATRLGEFKGVQRQQLAAGASNKEAIQAAAYASREVTVDFARRGAKTRAMNMITAFWNAGLQGTDRTIRAFRDDPGGTSLKMAAGITVPSMLLWWANHDDPRWQELPGWQRDLFWIVPTENVIFRIPKPPGIGQMFGSSAEHLLDAYFDSRPDALKEFGKSMTSMVAMSFVPTFAAPVVEQWANRSTFTERTLIPADLEGGLPEYMYTPYTTETAKALGQIIGAFPGIRDVKMEQDSPALGGVARALSTPILMENYVRAWTGGLGTYALQIADAGLRKSGMLPDPVKPEDTLADIPFVKAFVVRYPSGSAESIQRFYDAHEKNKRYFDTWMAKAQEGDVVAMQHVQDMGGPRIFVQFDAIKEAVGEHSKLIRAIYKDPAMNANDKRQLIDQLYYSEIQVAQAGIGAMRQVSAALAP